MTTNIDEFFKGLSSSLGPNKIDPVKHHAKQMSDDLYQTVLLFIERSLSYNESKYYEMLDKAEELDLIEEQCTAFCDERKLLQRIQVDQVFWRESLVKIINGEWNLKTSPTTIESYSQVILSFYAYVQKISDVQVLNTIPVLLSIDRKAAEVNYVCGLWSGIGDNPKRKEMIKLKKGVTNTVNKRTIKWEKMISIIENLHQNGRYKDCESFSAVADETRDEMKELKKEGTITGKDLQSIDTIKRCLTEVFHITPDSFTQPLSLPSKVKR